MLECYFCQVSFNGTVHAVTRSLTHFRTTSRSFLPNLETSCAKLQTFSHGIRPSLFPFFGRRSTLASCSPNQPPHRKMSFNMRAFSAFLIAIALFATSILAHMQLVYPAPFNASNNPHRTTPEDIYLQYPYDCCGPGARWVYPCRGYLDLLGTPDGDPTASWEAGSSQSWNMSGIGNHYGGSCQVGFLDYGVDGKNETFRVATSYEGNCPHRKVGADAAGQIFEFKVPTDLEAGVQVFAWIWYNREQEFNMNCAAVNITAPSSSPAPTSTPPMAPSLSGYGMPSSTSVAAAAASSSKVPDHPLPVYQTANGCTCNCPEPTNISTCTCICPNPPTSANKRNTEDGGELDLHGPAFAYGYQHLPHEKRSTPTPAGGTSSSSPGSSSSVAFTNRPLMLVADDGNGCFTPKKTAEVKYPDPGPDVIVGDGEYPLELPSGTCAGVGGQGYHGA